MLDRKGARRRWLQARAADLQYGASLARAARAVADIIRGMRPDGTEAGTRPLISALGRYAAAIEPWAQAAAERMLADVNRRNLRTWSQVGREISRGLRAEIESTPVGTAVRAMQAENVELIRSLPLKAAEGVQQLVQEGMYASTRSSVIAERIMESADVPKWRAKLIARTEVSRASTVLTQARAQAVGSTGYIWRTSKDGDVRPLHKAMEGEFVRWDDPPPMEPSLGSYHAGCGPNCRCWPEPILPDF